MNELLDATTPSGRISYSVQEAASRTGLSEHNLRYYERVGLLPPAERLPKNGHRRYSDSDIEWIRFLVCLRETRMPIVQMRRYARLREQGVTTLEARRLMLEEHREALAAQIEELEQSRLFLNHKIDYYHLTEHHLEAGLPVPTYRMPERRK